MGELTLVRILNLSWLLFSWGAVCRPQITERSYPSHQKLSRRKHNFFSSFYGEHVAEAPFSLKHFLNGQDYLGEKFSNVATVV